ncbi:MAG: pseudouridine synthase, partial [Candidatus Eiseniibacteriota bacterium]
HKPAGLLVSRRSQGGRQTIFDVLGARARGLHAVGRLDMDSEGILLLTDDGTLSESLLHPRTRLVRTYRIWVRPIPTSHALRALAEGVLIEGERVEPLRVIHEGAERGEGILRVELTEGKKREVRLLARAAGLHVARLLRTQFGPIRLSTLRAGALRLLLDAEVEALRAEAFPRAGRR